LMPGHCFLERREIVDVAGDDLQAPVAEMLLVVPRLAGGEVVVDRDAADVVGSQQPVDEVAADEAGAADDEVMFAHEASPPHPPAPSPTMGRGGERARERCQFFLVLHPLSPEWERGLGGEGAEVASHFVARVFSAGWLTSRCQTTAHSPSVCGV